MDWLVSGCCKLWNISNNIRMNSLQCCNFTQGKRKLNLCDRSFTVLLYYEDLSIRWMWLLLKYFNASLTIDNLYFLQLLCRPPKANKMNFGFSVSICCLFKKCCFIAYAMFKKEIYLSVGNIFCKWSKINFYYPQNHFYILQRIKYANDVCYWDSFLE